ncbi:1034_t:CDS:2, partial [Scutellospora calospora]
DLDKLLRQFFIIQLSFVSATDEEINITNKYANITVSNPFKSDINYELEDIFSSSKGSFKSRIFIDGLQMILPPFCLLFPSSYYKEEELLDNTFKDIKYLQYSYLLLIEGIKKCCGLKKHGNAQSKTLRTFALGLIIHTLHFASIAYFFSSSDDESSRKSSFLCETDSNF